MIETTNKSEMLNWINSLNKELVSIVLPTYNRPRFLEKSLEYISKQINPPQFEIIVVDDGSYPENAKLNDSICEHYSNKFDFDITSILLPENSGTVSIPRNIGISYISGRYIAPTDDDCLFTTNKLNGLYDSIKDKYGVWTPLVYGNRLESIYNDTNICTPKYIQSKGQDPYAVGLDNGQFIYDAMIYLHIKPSLAINACDWELYKQIAELGSFIHIDEPVCNYLWHGKNASIVPKEKRTNPKDVINKFKDYFKNGPIKNEIFQE